MLTILQFPAKKSALNYKYQSVLTCKWESDYYLDGKHGT